MMTTVMTQYQYACTHSDVTIIGDDPSTSIGTPTTMFTNMTTTITMTLFKPKLAGSAQSAAELLR